MNEAGEPAECLPVLYREAGSSWWPVLWGPAFAAVGAAVEATAGPVHGLAWALVGLGLAGLAAIWVRARRQFCSVLLTPHSLRQGREALPVSRIAEVAEVAEACAPVGARVLGGGWTVPKRFVEVPLRLHDDHAGVDETDAAGADGGSGGTSTTSDQPVVIAWARDPAALRAALRPLVKA